MANANFLSFLLRPFRFIRGQCIRGHSDGGGVSVRDDYVLMLLFFFFFLRSVGTSIYFTLRTFGKVKEWRKQWATRHFSSHRCNEAWTIQRRTLNACNSYEPWAILSFAILPDWLATNIAVEVIVVIREYYYSHVHILVYVRMYDWILMDLDVHLCTAFMIKWRILVSFLNILEGGGGGEELMLDTCVRCPLK